MINLFFNHYLCKERQHEIDTALENNRKVFDKVILVEGRPTFSELFAITKDYPNDINCFCNSDVYFKDTSLLKGIRPNECYALTRYDLVNGKEVFFNRQDSQDAWVFRGEVKVKADFTAGLWGCDNRLAYEIKMAGYALKNPSLSIKTIHLHKEDNRNHARNEKNTVPPPYLRINPTA